MSIRYRLSDAQWQRIESFIEAGRRQGRRGRNDRLFIEAVLWIQRTASPWRDLPAEFGPWKTVYNRFSEWSKQARWEHLFESLKQDGDTEWMSLDATVVRVHQHGAGAKGGSRLTASVAHAAG